MLHSDRTYSSDTRTDASQHRHKLLTSTHHRCCLRKMPKQSKKLQHGIISQQGRSSRSQERINPCNDIKPLHPTLGSRFGKASTLPLVGATDIMQTKPLEICTSHIMSSFCSHRPLYSKRLDKQSTENDPYLQKDNNVLSEELCQTAHGLAEVPEK
jgi:hypothetical protein